MDKPIHYEEYIIRWRPLAEQIFTSMMTTSDRNVETPFEIHNLGVKATKYAMAFDKAFKEVMCGRA